MILILLSQCNTQALIGLAIFSSLRNFWIHTLSRAACSRAIYLGSVVDVETVRSFLLHQETITLYMIKQYSITDVLFSESLAWLLSAYSTSPHYAGAMSVSVSFSNGGQTP